MNGISAPAPLPADTRLGRVRLRVGDLDRSSAYYERVLGLAPSREGGAVYLSVGDGTVLVELHELAGAAPPPSRARGRLGLYHFAILLPDRASLGRFAGHLARMGVGAGASDHRVSEALYLRDPDGLGIEVYADRPRAEWEYEGSQLVMRTDPLDVDALIRAGGEGDWTGSPPESRVGHIHLHVGDLDAAEDFYHRALGFDKVVWSYPGALFLSAGGYHHHLGVNTWAVGATPPEEGDAGLLEWELQIPSDADVGEVLERLEAAGHPVRREGGSGAVRDPWGTPLRVVSP